MRSIELRYSFEVFPKDIIADLMSDIDSGNVAGALLFMAADIEHGPVCQHFDELFPYAGCTVSNSFSNEFPLSAPEQTSQTALLIVFYGPDTLASGFLSSFPKSTDKLFCFSTHEIYAREPLQRLRLIGGIASASIEKTPPAVWANKLISSDGIVAMSIPDVTISIDVAHGWTAIKRHKMEVTRIEDTRLYELDGKSAIDTYRSLVLDQQIFILFPLYSENKEKFVTVVSTNENEGYLQLTQPLSAGDYVNISGITRLDILNGTEALASASYVKSKDDTPELIFCISCSSREWMLNDDPSAEYRRLEPFYSDKKIAVIYLDGEFAPLETGSEHLNHSFVMTTLYHADSDRLPDF